MDEILLLVVYSISPVDGSKRLFYKKSFVFSQQAAAIVLWNYGIHAHLIEMGAYLASLYNINLDTKEIKTVNIPAIEFKEDS